jgi:hypothetical protein
MLLYLFQIPGIKLENQPMQPQNQGPPTPQKRGPSQKQIGAIVIGVIAIVVVAILAISLASGANSKEVKIVVKCSGSWGGAYGESGSVNSWSGSGDKTIVYTRTSSTNPVVASVVSTSFSTITVQIVSMNGQVLKESTGTMMAQVTWTP